MLPAVRPSSEILCDYTERKYFFDQTIPISGAMR